MNTGFQKAIRLLAHPLNLAAAVLILVNDFLLRPVAPSWWTGKLSDAGALVIWPLLFAAALALILPRRWKHSHALAGGLALGLTLAGYLLLKLSPATNALLLALSGQRLRAVADPSDLLLLPILLLPAWLRGPPGCAGSRSWRGWYCWWGSPMPPPQSTASGASHKRADSCTGRPNIQAT